MFAGKIAVGQRLLNAIFNLLIGLFQFHRVQFLHHSLGLFLGSFLALLCVDRLKHFSNQLFLVARHPREHIAVKVDSTPLVLGFREYSSDSLQHTKTLVANNEFHSIQATPTKPFKGTGLAGFVLFHALGSTKNLTISVLIDRNCHKNGYIFKLSAPVRRR